MKRRFLSTLMALVLALSLIPTAALAAEGEPTLSTDIEEQTFTVGEYTTFKFTTTVGNYTGSNVYGVSNFSNTTGNEDTIDALDYQQGEQWIDMKGKSFGDTATGFPMANATSTFRVKFNTPGEYTFTAYMIPVGVTDYSQAVCSTEVTFTVDAAPVEDPEATINGQGYATLADALSAAQDGQTVTLEKNVTFDNAITIADDKTITLNLNGYTATYNGNDTYAIKLGGGVDLTITGQGTLSGTKRVIQVGNSAYDGSSKGTPAYLTLEGGSTISTNYVETDSGGDEWYQCAIGINANNTTDHGADDAIPCVVTINDATVTGAVYLFGQGAELNINSGATLTSTSSYAIGGNGGVSGKFNHGGTEINITGGTIMQNTTETVKSGTAIYHPQDGILNISGNPTITGYTGIQLCSGESVIANITGGTITGNGADARADKESDGVIPDGAAISVVNRSYPGGTPKMNIGGGTFTSQESSAVLAYTWSNNGNTTWGEANQYLSITGGTFSSDPSDYVAEGYEAVKYEKGGETVYVVEKPEYNDTVEGTIQAGKTDVSVSDDINSNDKNAATAAAQSVAESVSEDSVLAGAALSKAQAADKNTAITELAKENLITIGEGGTIADGKTVSVVAQYYFNVTATAYTVNNYNATSNAITFDITPMYQLVATTNSENIVTEDGEGKNAVLLGKPQELEISEPITMNLDLPADFFGTIENPTTAYVTHFKDSGAVYQYEAEVTAKDGNAGYTITFKNPNGFSLMRVAATQDEAAIGGQAYSTLEEAIAAVASASNPVTITLLTDVTVEDTITIPANVTLDGGESKHKITASTEESAFTATDDDVILVNGNNAGVKNLVVDGSGKSRYGIQFYDASNCTIENVTSTNNMNNDLHINASTVTAKGSIEVDADSRINVGMGRSTTNKTANFDITNATLTNVSLIYADTTDSERGTITVTDGEHDYVSVADQTGAPVCYIPVAAAEANAAFKVTASDGTPTYYYQDSSLLTAAPAAGENSTITLLDNVTVNEQIKINDANVILIGNSHTLSAAEGTTIANGGLIDITANNATVQNMTINTNGSAKYGVQFYNSTGGELIGVTINGGSYSSVNVNASEVDMINCTLNPGTGSYATIDYSIGSAEGLNRIPEIELNNVTTNNAGGLKIWADYDTITRVQTIKGGATTAAQAAEEIRSKINTTNNDAVLVSIEVNEDSDPVNTTIPSTKPTTPPTDSGNTGSSGGGSSEPSYSPVMDVTGNGDVSVNPRTPSEGDEVTITVDPDRGYEVDEVIVRDRNGNRVDVTAERNGTYTFEQPRGRVTIEVTFVRAGESAFFDDVPASFWAYDEIAWAYDNGYVNGTSATTFSPNSSITRQQVWMILARLSGADPASMAAAREWVMVNDISDGTNPGNAVTRQQLVALLYRYAQMMGYDNGAREALTSFPDAGTVSGYAQEPMQWSVANGIVAGTSAGTLNPTGTATRAQFAVILYRFWDQVG